MPSKFGFEEPEFSNVNIGLETIQQICLVTNATQYFMFHLLIMYHHL